MKFMVKLEIKGSDLMLQLRTDDDTLVVSVVGDLDMVVAKEFRETVDSYLFNHQWIKHLMVDLSGVNFMDSSGLGVILGRYKLMRNRGGQMALCGVNDGVYRVLELSGVKKLMVILRTAEEKAQ